MMLQRGTTLRRWACAAGPQVQMLQQRFAGGPKTGGPRRPRFVPNPRFVGQRPSRPRRFNARRALEQHWRAMLLGPPRRGAVAAQAAAAEPAIVDRSDGTREATFSGRLLAEETRSFEDLGVDDRVLPHLPRMGVLQPTPVQQAAIPVLLAAENAAIQSYTGSGKTLAYLLPLLSLAIQRSEAEWEALHRAGRAREAGTLQALVVAPSRELAMQIVRVAQGLLPAEARGCIQQAIGGANPVRQVEAIQRNRPLVIVGTPGRLAEFSRNGVLLTHSTPVLVLDEVDQLLAPQFREDVVRLEEQTGRKAQPRRQTVLVSATLSQRVLQECAAWAPDAVRVRLSEERTIGEDAAAVAAGGGSASAGPPAWGWDGFGSARQPGGGGSAGGRGTGDLVPAMPPQLEHGWVAVTRRHRVDATRRVIHALNAQRALIFMNFHRRLQDTEAKLGASRMRVATLSGDMTKQQRATVLANFRRGDYRALVVSDLLARGLDISDCDAVINLELPSDAAHYAHRAGRTGRAGRPGTVVSLVEPAEQFVMQKLARRLGVDVPELRLHAGRFSPAQPPPPGPPPAGAQDWLAPP